MKGIIVHIIHLLLIFISYQGFAQEAKINIREGNEAYKNNEFKKAEELYRQSIRQKPDMIESNFNLGDALYRQEKYEDASRYFNMAAERAEDKEIKAKAYHNLGNSYLKEKKFKESIEAYKKSLINNPEDEDTRFNLAYAKQQLKKKQEQQKKEQKQKQKQEKEQKQDQNQEQQEQEQQKEQQQKKGQQEQEEEQKQQQEQQKQQEQQEQKQEKKPQPQPDQVSREDAKRILEALENKEKKVQENLKKREVEKTDINIEKDW